MSRPEEPIDEVQERFKPFYKQLAQCSENYMRIADGDSTQTDFWQQRQDATEALERAREAATKAGMGSALQSRAVSEGKQKARTALEQGM